MLWLKEKLPLHTYKTAKGFINVCYTKRTQNSVGKWMSFICRKNKRILNKFMVFSSSYSWVAVKTKWKAQNKSTKNPGRQGKTSINCPLLCVLFWGYLILSWCAVWYTGKLQYLDHRYVKYHGCLEVSQRSRAALLYSWF